jgi:hypothetical protein
LDTSIFLARLLGPMLVVLGIGLIAFQDSWRAMAKEFFASRPMIFMSGFLTLLGGLAIVNTHNVWQGGWPVIITILGWLAVVGGITRMLFPTAAIDIGEHMLGNRTSLTVAGAVEGLVGLWLCYAGYLA